MPQTNKNIFVELSKLQTALDKLEASVKKRMPEKEALEQAQQEVQNLNFDRNKLANKLDRAEAYVKQLAQANENVSLKIIKINYNIF